MVVMVVLLLQSIDFIVLLIQQERNKMRVKSQQETTKSQAAKRCQRNEKKNKKLYGTYTFCIHYLLMSTFVTLSLAYLVLVLKCLCSVLLLNLD